MIFRVLGTCSSDRFIELFINLIIVVEVNIHLVLQMKTMYHHRRPYHVFLMLPLGTKDSRLDTVLTFVMFLFQF